TTALGKQCEILDSVFRSSAKRRIAERLRKSGPITPAQSGPSVLWDLDEKAQMNVVLELMGRALSEVPPAREDWDLVLAWLLVVTHQPDDRLAIIVDCEFAEVAVAWLAFFDFFGCPNRAPGQLSEALQFWRDIAVMLMGS